jgi:hypothetical protein
VRNREGKRMSVQANINSGSGGRGAGKQKVQRKICMIDCLAEMII